MKAVLLAAGRGSRLGPLTQSVPKPLLSVGGRTCLDIVLESLSAAAENIVLVTGYLGDKIKDHLKQCPPPASTHIVVNHKPERGNLTSLEAARDFIEGCSFILANGDHLFPHDFYSSHFIGKEHISIAVQNNRSVLEDEMKVVLKGKKLCKISKTLTEYDGAYIGSTRVPASLSSVYWTAFDKVREEMDPNEACVEDVLRVLSDCETPPRAVLANNITWFEIDTPEDLDKARNELGP